MGNVLVYFSHDKMCQQIGALCGTTGPDIRQKVFDSEVQWNFERGFVSELEFLNFLEETFNTTIELTELKRATADIFVPNLEIVPIIQSLKEQGYRIVLMSNTCITHYEWVRDHYPHLGYFDDLVLSYEAGAIKPEAPIYESALRKIDCQPEECFYTDDIQAYIDQAKNYGLHAEVYVGNSQLIDHLIQHGISISPAKNF